jgi:ferritin-like metal-binding protein YciE
MTIATVGDLSLEQRQVMPSGKRQIITALPKPSRSLHAAALVEALVRHLGETKAQLARLTRILDASGGTLGRASAHRREAQ